MGRNFVIAAGGTGGHLFPGLAVGEVLIARGHSVMLIVSEKEIDATATQGRTEFRVEKVPGVGLQGKSPIAILKFALKFRAGLAQCHRLFADFQPAAVIGMGGFTSLAPILAGRKRGIPRFVHESNAIPGKSNKLNARFCTAVLLGFEECAKFFGNSKCIVTGTPIRGALVNRMDRAEAVRSFGLDPERKTLLVMGGSQGAKGINDALAAALPELKSGGAQVVHFTGSGDDERMRAAYSGAGVPAFVAPFFHEMQRAYAAADFAIARSGAASLTEISHYALPSILIPYPHAAEDHQTLNAEIFERGGAAVLIQQRDLGSGVLGKRLAECLEPAKLSEMSRQSAALAPNDAASRVADVILSHAKS